MHRSTVAFVDNITVLTLAVVDGLCSRLALSLKVSVPVPAFTALSTVKVTRIDYNIGSGFY
jgi:hypothetical protein